MSVVLRCSSIYVCPLFKDGCMNVKVDVDEKKSWMVLSNTVVNPISLFTADQTIHNRDDILVTRDMFIYKPIL